MSCIELRLEDTHWGAFHRTDWTSRNVVPAVETTDLMPTWRENTVDSGVEANNTNVTVR